MDFEMSEMNEMNDLNELNDFLYFKITHTLSYLYFCRKIHAMQNDSSEFVQNVSNKEQEREEIYRSTYFVVSKIRMFNQWRIEKKLTQAYEFQPIQRNSLEREFENGYQLDHPNIVRYLELQKTEQGVPYIIMEFVDGKNLQEYMNSDETFSTDEFSRIIKDLLNALVYLQHKQIYHLDIKPENILITHKEHIPKLIDFGLSSNDTYQTTLGSTKHYSSKEHLEYNKISSKTDMYSFAKTILTFASQKHIHLNPKEKKILKRCSQEEIEKRLDASTALQELESRGKYGFPFVLCSIILLSAILIINLRHEKNENSNNTITKDLVDTIPVNSKIENTKDTAKVLIIKPQSKNVITRQSCSRETNTTESRTSSRAKIDTTFAKYLGKDNNQIQIDSIYMENIAKQKLKKFAELINTKTIDKYDLQCKLSQEYHQESDSIINMYMNSNQFGMVSAVSHIEYKIWERVESEMDSMIHKN